MQNNIAFFACGTVVFWYPGIVQCHEQDGLKRVKAYASRVLSKPERSCPVHKVELLTLKFAIIEKFRDYIYDHMCVL